MGKVIGQFAILAVAFASTWFLLSNFDLVRRFQLEELSKESERKLGSVVLSEVKREHRELDSDTAQRFVNNIYERLCTANQIPDSSITLHIVVSDVINAFAIPDNQLVVYTGLMDDCHSPEELAGVLSHEIAHIEHRHVMKKLMKEVGLAMLTTISSGDAGREIGQETVRLLSSTAFDRQQESEADTAAVRMMQNASINPAPFADLLFRLSQEKKGPPRALDWLSTHPNSQDRASEILRLSRMESDRSTPISDSATWNRIRVIVRERAGRAPGDEKAPSGG